MLLISFTTEVSQGQKVKFQGHYEIKSRSKGQSSRSLWDQGEGSNIPENLCRYPGILHMLLISLTTEVSQGHKVKSQGHYEIKVREENFKNMIR